MYDFWVWTNKRSRPKVALFPPPYPPDLLVFEWIPCFSNSILISVGRWARPRNVNPMTGQVNGNPHFQLLDLQFHSVLITFSSFCTNVMLN